MKHAMKVITETLLGIRSGPDDDEADALAATTLQRVPLQSMQVIGAWYDQQHPPGGKVPPKSKKQSRKRLASEAQLEHSGFERPPVIVFVRDFEAFDSRVREVFASL